jgi:hypothetical protein
VHEAVDMEFKNAGNVWKIYRLSLASNRKSLRNLESFCLLRNSDWLSGGDVDADSDSDAELVRVTLFNEGLLFDSILSFERRDNDDERVFCKKCF